MTTVLNAPSTLVFEEAIKFSQEIRQLPMSGNVLFDFRRTRKFDPFSMLYLSSQINSERKKRIDNTWKVINHDHLTYAAHMGFFRAFGVSFGKKPGEAFGNRNYIPITIYDTQIIKSQARSEMVNSAEVLEDIARGMSKVLTRSEKGELYDILTYCIREILRNVVEHSKSDKFAFCAQYLPSVNRVSLVIIDKGIGIAKSLSDNPTLNLSNDEAISPGVSGKVYKGQRKKQKGDWVNSGFGLYMTSNICKQGGSFFLSSGDKGLYMSESKSRFLETPTFGTAVNLVINTDGIKSLNGMLKELRENAATDEVASRSSLGLSKSL
jgi:hypothetical protein